MSTVSIKIIEIINLYDTFKNSTLSFMHEYFNNPSYF